MSEITILVTVKAYPALSMRYGEVVCVAGIEAGQSNRWIRLFPVPFREMPYVQRFRKYEFITLNAGAHTSDSRPETRRPEIESVQVGELLDTRRAWERRREVVEPVVVESMCWIQKQQQLDRTSLGAFRPWAVDDLIVEENEPWTSSQQRIAAQASLFFPDRAPLERVPFKFKYQYRCGAACNGHTQSIIDWEIAEAWRSWSNGKTADEAVRLIREKWLDQICGSDRDTIFFVGNQHRFPESFLVLGTFWPPKERAAQQRLL